MVEIFYLQKNASVSCILTWSGTKECAEVLHKPTIFDTRMDLPPHEIGASGGGWIAQGANECWFDPKELR